MICQEKELMQQVIRWVKEEVQIPVIAKLSIHVNDIGKWLCMRLKPEQMQ